MKSIGKIVSIFLVASTLSSSLFVPLIYLDFKVRQDYIATVLCVNRDKPELNCNGQCILMQKIKEAQEQEEEAPGVTYRLEISFFFSDLPQFELNNPESNMDNNLELYNTSNLLKGHPSEIFHPPSIG